MCGIFGVLLKKDCNVSKTTAKDILVKIAKYSEVRGKDSSGFVFRNESENKLKVIKGPVPVSSMLISDEFKTNMSRMLNHSSPSEKLNQNFAVIGHARLTTNGTQLKDINNQPVVKDGIIGIHNGIIVNVNELWAKYRDIQRCYDIDTEVMLSLFRKYLRASNTSIYAIVKTAREIFGTIAAAILTDDTDEFILTTNNGSLYVLTDEETVLIFASERYILESILKNSDLNKHQPKFKICQLPACTGIVLDLVSFKFNHFNYENVGNSSHALFRNKKFDISVKNISSDWQHPSAVIDIQKIFHNARVNAEIKKLEYNIEKISVLRRCKKCLLPETFPFISFDDHGICNICRNYKRQNKYITIEELQKLVEPYRGSSKEPNCIVPFSGGRDSTYVLHIVKNILKLNPIAFTYDWGMVTDLGRRNIARVCGKLGVENIIVSADIQWKRENIRKNITAWLKNPCLGMIPLFMAGDKFFFYYTELIKKQTNIKLNIWGINPLENTDFKVGFCGIPLRYNKKRIYSLALIDQLRLFLFVSKNVLLSPGYINQSVLDSLGSIFSRYFVTKKDYYHLFDFYRWDEQEIEDLIKNEYNWETAIDTKSTWRIGDGTAAFYNYIYYTVAGFSEYDTFRSNQIREGMITREKALCLVNDENKPRYESIKWYLDIIGMDYNTVIPQINSIPKLYEKFYTYRMPATFNKRFTKP